MDTKDLKLYTTLWMDNWEEAWDLFLQDERRRSELGLQLLEESCDRIRKEREKKN